MFLFGVQDKLVLLLSIITLEIMSIIDTCVINFNYLLFIVLERRKRKMKGGEGKVERER